MARFIVFFCIGLILTGGGQANAQRIKKVRARNVIVAYDTMGNVIDSLTHDLTTQSDKGQYLDKIQVDLRNIEISLKETTNPARIDKLTVLKDTLYLQKMSMIRDIQDEKFDLVVYYYVVVESFKKKKNALDALKKWNDKGLKHAFLFHNKVRKWWYVVASVQRTYRKANLSQWELQQKGISSWIYYWIE